MKCLWRAREAGLDEARQGNRAALCFPSCSRHPCPDLAAVAPQDCSRWGKDILAAAAPCARATASQNSVAAAQHCPPFQTSRLCTQSRGDHPPPHNATPDSLACACLVVSLRLCDRIWGVDPPCRGRRSPRVGTRRQLPCTHSNTSWEGPRPSRRFPLPACAP
jgi:hypothetical protein